MAGAPPLVRDFVPDTPVWGSAPHPTRGLCPLDSQSGALPLDPGRGSAPAPWSGALPPTPPQGPLALDPFPQALTGLGDCFYIGFSFGRDFLCEVRFRPHGRPKGFPIALWKPSDASSLIWPLTHHPEIPKDFRGVFLEKSYEIGLSVPEQPGGFPIGPPPLRFGNSPSATAHWAVRFPWTPSVCILVSRLCRNKKTVSPTNILIPLHPEGARRFPKGDRKALWSPVRAKPRLAQKQTFKGKTHIQTIPQAR